MPSLRFPKDIFRFLFNKHYWNINLLRMRKKTNEKYVNAIYCLWVFIARAYLTRIHSILCKDYLTAILFWMLTWEKNHIKYTDDYQGSMRSTTIYYMYLLSASSFSISPIPNMSIQWHFTFSLSTIFAEFPRAKWRALDNLQHS